jgi:hypothetical protein
MGGGLSEAREPPRQGVVRDADLRELLHFNVQVHVLLL